MKTPREILLGRHRDVEPKLDEIWRATLRRGLNVTDATKRVPSGNVIWRELIWPCRRIWAGLACAWSLILVLNGASFEPSARVVSKTEPRSREEMQALVEQRRLLAQLIKSGSEPSDKHESKPPGPRSEKALKTLAA